MVDDKPFCVIGGEVISNVPTIESLATYIKDYILNEAYGSSWSTDMVKGATRQAIYNIIQTVVGQLEYKGLWDASGGSYPVDPQLGWYYVVSVPGEVSGIQYEIGDWIIWNGTSWDKLAGKTDVSPIGCIWMYDGTGIADVLTRTEQIGDRGGDTFRMNGWYVCNGLVSTPDLIKSFIRGDSVSGSTGGDDDSIVVQHNHGASQASHNHNVKGRMWGGTSTGVNGDLADMADQWLTGFTNSKTPTITIDNEGVSGVDKNMPVWYSLIFIIKKG